MRCLHSLVLLVCNLTRGKPSIPKPHTHPTPISEGNVRARLYKHAEHEERRHTYLRHC